MKKFYTMESITGKEICSDFTFEKINFYFKSTKPLVDFIILAIEKNPK